MYTQKEVENMVNNIGGILIGDFKGMKIKTDFQCPICNVVYQRTPGAVIQQKQVRCNKCRYISSGNKRVLSHQYVQQKFAQYNLMLLEPYVRSDIEVKTRCSCGKEFYTLPVRVVNGRKKSCGCCDHPNIGDKFGHLTITNVIVNHSHTGCKIEALCDCGRKVGPYAFSRIKLGITKSCGHCLNPNIGDRFGKLVVVEVFEAFNGGCQIICRCDCGRLWGPKKCYVVLSGNTTTCGHCETLRNGIPTSNIALKLHTVVEQILAQKCEHNYQIKTLGYIDIACPNLQIAIEYDGWYWHKDKTDQDELRYTKIINNGWKLLNIKSDGTDLPSHNELYIALLQLLNGITRQTIIMPSWNQKQKMDN